ncbi:hypothetical protein SteCoe_10373 [Stentor coeruleus]|uniref:Uncharacterized protein n=1 Tax=Stentor coeruleus TaxID=5963 RepID=A0A1R2CFL1_9CILI|nr:hypothetical protein SteCoe_10373 [Stentor coeruleus]
MECTVCRKPASYICRCRRPAAYFCHRDLEVHKKLYDYPIHKDSSYPILASQESKNILLEHIKKLCEACQNQIETLNLKTVELTEYLANNLHELLENLAKCCDQKVAKLDGFIQDMKYLSDYIKEINTIDVKDFYTPLENALLKVGNAEKFVSKLEGPSIIYPKLQTNNLFKMIPSNVYHLIGNYNFSVHLSNSCIQYMHPGEEIKTIPCEYLSDTSRALRVGENSIIITGGDNIPQCALLFNLKKKFIDNLSLLEKPRKNHAMAWIGNKPAVLGGENPNHYKHGHDAYKSVEIFESNRWVYFNSMCKARNKLTACNYLDKVYVVGGVDNRNQHVNGIEVLEGDTWREVFVEFPYHLNVAIPVVFLHSNLVLLLGNKGGIIFFDLPNSSSSSTIESGTNALSFKELLNENSHNHAFIKKGVYTLLNKESGLTDKYGVFF